ncbi:MAG: DUF1800 domain-containing protein [Alphaproteobacteria bacterium]|nr:DUF1800 domain-containing protein [Alphaproteobacteria bacterium]
MAPSQSALLAAAIAANRFGLGARPDDLPAIAEDPRGWLKSQLTPETELPAPLQALPSTLEDQLAFLRWLGKLRREGRAADVDIENQRPGGGTGGAGMEGEGFSVERSFAAEFGPRLIAAAKARFDTAVTTQRPLFERLVHFWSNHFVVSSAKPATVAMPPSFERDVARAHAVGRFEDLLLASTTHPAMLLYLDNVQSVGPNSAFARDPDPKASRNPLQQRPTGLNENLAREILELHTVGVNGGYTQADVTSFAKIITGWGYRAPSLRLVGQAMMPGDLEGRDLFAFDPEKHEPGDHTVMGKTYPEGGFEQGRAVLADLAVHPSTARFIAFKLARHFIADDPPPAVVDRMALSFRETGGDVRAVMTALIESPEAWTAELAKFKRPEEFLVSTFRAGPGPALPGPAVLAIQREMGQQPYYQPGPDGWADTQDRWMGADAVWKRVEWSIATARGLATAARDPASLAAAVLGPLASAETLASIARAESPAQGLAILLASPEFQRR